MRPLGWQTLHSIEVGRHGSDLDHLVIGPGGVFVINTKRSPGARVTTGRTVVFVRGRQTPYVRNSEFEARRAGQLLSAAAGRTVTVRPMLVFVGALVRGERAGTVTVLPRSRLLIHLQMRGRELSADEVDELHELARRPSTWHPVGSSR